MCTLIVLKDVFEKYPLVVASNRDENPKRPSAPPLFWFDDPEIYAPRDLVRGGTWIGVNRQGVIAALTNLDTVAHRRGCKSRGQLLVEMLDLGAADQVDCLLAGDIDNVGEFGSTREPYNLPVEYNGLNLVVADSECCILLVNDGNSTKITRLGSGAHIITGYGVGPDHAPRASEITRRLRDIKNPSPEELDKLLNFHADGRPEAAACVHDPNEYHKTISSMIVRADRNWTRFETWFRAGPACSGPFDERFDVEFRKDRSES